MFVAIHTLLRSSGGGRGLVQLVLTDIKDRGWHPSSHIYTMLVDHHLSQEPADIAAAEDLIAEFRQREPMRDSRVFWLRVMNGYAKAGELDESMEVFRRLMAASTSISPHDATRLLRGLVQHGRMDDARKLVNGVLGSAGEGPAKEGERQWRHRFWHVAQENGLLEGVEQWPPSAR